MISSLGPFRARAASLHCIFLLLAVSISGTVGWAQSAPEPRREQLLNGLNVVLWERPGDADVLLKLRIHSGAAFDLAGKTGTMALLADALYPDTTTREYITNELGGRVEVAADYDAINITLSGRARDYERLVDLLRTAIVNLSITPDRVAELRTSRAKAVGQTWNNPSAIADRMASARLFGDYPYGRPSGGSGDTLTRIERADIQYARERFLNPNNSTLVVAGGVQRTRAMRALRQLLGQWRKSEAIVPSTFRLPETPDTSILIVDVPGSETTEVRLALKGLARSDSDYAAALLLAMVARDRWQTSVPELSQSALFVRQEARVLPGIFVMGASVRGGAEAARAISAAQKVLLDLSKTPPTVSEFERARNEAVTLANQRMGNTEALASLWLDADTYKLTASAQGEARSLASMTPADLQRVARRLMTSTTATSSVSNNTSAAPVAVVVVGNAAQLKTELERLGKVEIRNQSETPVAPPKPSGTGTQNRKSP